MYRWIGQAKDVMTINSFYFQFPSETEMGKISHEVQYLRKRHRKRSSERWVLLHKQLLSPYLAVKTSGERERWFEKEALLKSIAFTDLWGNRLVTLLSPQHLQLSITVQWIWHSICQTRALVRPLRGTVGTGEMGDLLTCPLITLKCHSLFSLIWIPLRRNISAKLFWKIEPGLLRSV